MLKISIITPTLNQSKFLPKSIESVLSQDYKKLEYIIIDGGSTDGTIEILQSSKDIIWRSEKDKGQSDAINKGLKISTGDIICYLNSDDILEPQAVEKVNKFFTSNPDFQWVAGKCNVINEQDEKVRLFVTSYKNFWLKYFRSCNLLKILNFIPQPASFWRREAMEKVGYFNEKLHYTMDYDYWLRLIRIYKLGYIDEYLASFRIQFKSKSSRNTQKLFDEGYQTVKYYSHWPYQTLHRLHDIFSVSIYRYLY